MTSNTFDSSKQNLVDGFVPPVILKTSLSSVCCAATEGVSASQGQKFWLKVQYEYE
jgi:hypothetical protein